MFANLFGKGKKNKSPSSNSQFHVARVEDKEEDGFLLVGETTAERSTVHAGQLSQQNLPPSYSHYAYGVSQQSQVNPPNYSCVQAQMQQAADSVPSPHYSQYNNQPMRTSVTDFSNSAEFSEVVTPSTASVLSGVPFQLAYGLEVALNTDNQTQSQFSRIQSQPDWSKYDYDFSLERGVVREAWQSCE
ncbi:uncharacterized protein LOC106165441 [Lingula anatina]|uniref:Uncharacterized protein LOC106165441 n=1 Tax=Lingula anatina TaxID=7574 RepID=A0A1S3ILZ7_LINAN|nr:uncharacterized protein LOC106165441 [Lingula anatina]XP_013399103.1 uncharacterized protein LOC106165441 [Lingula anatina]|eukprot:XP_013399101.1 uncharacterized protein LOC106165441 [Lingula anatina]